MTARRKALLGVAAACAAVAGLMMPAAARAYAQSPNPNNDFLDWYPGSVQYTTAGIVSEDLGSVNCSYNMYAAINDTVNSINAGHATITEVTPQSYCGSLSQYETWIADVNYIVNASTAAARNLWGGIMVDEEPNYAPESWYVSLNSYLASAMSGSPGAEWWYNEIGPCGGGICYSQAQYNQLLSSSWSSPQVYNSNFANYANADGEYMQMVTAWSGSPYPYDYASYASSVINGAPYNYQFGTPYTFNWENIYQSA